MLGQSAGFPRHEDPVVHMLSGSDIAVDVFLCYNNEEDNNTCRELGPEP